MAEPTPTSGAAPLTEAEQKQLDALTAKKAAAEAAALEANREARLIELAAVETFLKLVRTDKVSNALQAAIDSKPDVDTLQRLIRIKSTFDFDVRGLSDTLSQLAVPATSTPIA